MSSLRVLERKDTRLIERTRTDWRRSWEGRRRTAGMDRVYSSTVSLARQASAMEVSQSEHSMAIVVSTVFHLYQCDKLL